MTLHNNAPMLKINQPYAKSCAHWRVGYFAKHHRLKEIESRHGKHLYIRRNPGLAHKALSSLFLSGPSLQNLTLIWTRE